MMLRTAAHAVRSVCTTAHVKKPAQLARVTVARDNASLRVEWEGGGHATLDATWLRLACGSCLHETSQRLVNASDLAVFPSIIESAKIVTNSEATSCGHATATPTHSTCTVRFSDGHEAVVPPGVLERYAWKRPARRDPLDYKSPLTTTEWSRLTAAGAADTTVKNVELWTLLKGIAEQGLAVVDGMPDDDDALRTLAELIAPVKATLYGDTFEVRAEPNPINIAYTTHELALHMDLAYYESPPGLQLLWCREFTPEVTGGESTFVDAHEAAEKLRERHPESFATLTRVAARFQKDHIARENPAQMFYDRPHIVTHPRTGEITQVFWAPPFEGLLHAPAEDMQPYYRAYRHFAEIIENPQSMEDFGRLFKLRKGQCVIFNNRRMLHGRRAFDLHNTGVRHLKGCYVAIDDFQNKFLNLARQYADSHKVFPRIGNGDLCMRPAVGDAGEPVVTDIEGDATVVSTTARGRNFFRSM